MDDGDPDLLVKVGQLGLDGVQRLAGVQQGRATACTVNRNHILRGGCRVRRLAGVQQGY